jgi:hypothetical protein
LLKDKNTLDGPIITKKNLSEKTKKLYMHGLFFILRVSLLFYCILKFIKTKIPFFVGLKNDELENN